MVARQWAAIVLQSGGAISLGCAIAAQEHIYCSAGVGAGVLLSCNAAGAQQGTHLVIALDQAKKMACGQQRVGYLQLACVMGATQVLGQVVAQAQRPGLVKGLAELGKLGAL